MVSNGSLEKQLKQSKKQGVTTLVDAVAGYEAERQKLTVQVHDGLGQSSTALRFITERLSSSCKDDQMAKEARDLAIEIQVEVRKLLTDLQPKTGAPDRRDWR